MNIISVTKSWRGDEFCIPSLESIYKWVNKIIYVHSNIGWTGSLGNTVAPLIEEWKKANDKEDKVINLYLDTTSQEEQYNHAIKYIHENLECDWKFYFDTDECWDDDNWTKAMKHLNSVPAEVNALTCRMKTYIKSPFYLIEPLDTCCPVVFVRKGMGYTGVRGSGTQPRRCMENVLFHHFSAVRKRLDLVIEKHQVSSAVEGEPILPAKEWVENKWNLLPFITNFHPNTNYTGTWHRIKVVTKFDLPPAVREAGIVKAFEKYPMGRGMLFPAGVDVLKEAGLPPDFGPNHPDFNIPSKQNRYQAALQKIQKVHFSRLGLADPALPITSEKPPLISPDLNKMDDIKSLPPSKKNRFYQSAHNDGMCCIMTMVYGDYQWYIPLFIDRIKKEYPEYSIIIFTRGKIDIPSKYLDHCILDYWPSLPQTAYMTACLRFLVGDNALEKYDYVLITDIDMLIRRELPTLVDQHMLDLRVQSLQCYSNYVSSRVKIENTGYGAGIKHPLRAFEGGMAPRLPGVHFVTKEWWGKTRATREAYLEMLKTIGVNAWYYDEAMLAQIVLTSGLSIQSEKQNLWCHHGIHLGDYRLSVQKREQRSPMQADLQQYALRLMKDEEFMAKIEECGYHYPLIKLIFDKLWQNAKG